MIKLWIEVKRMDWWYTTLIVFVLCNIGLELCCDLYCPLMVEVLVFYTIKGMASTILLYELYLTWNFWYYFINGDIIMLRVDYEQCEGLYVIRVCVRLNSHN